MTHIRRHFLLLAILATTTLSGCFSHKMIRVSQRPTRLTVLVDVAPNANANNPIAVDIITVANQQLFNQLLATTSQDWFANRSTLLAGHAAQLRIQSIQLTAGTPQAPIVVEKTARAAGVLLFANYSTPGAHSTVLPIAAIVSLHFQASNFEEQILP